MGAFPITENEPTVTQKKKQASEPSRPATHNRLEARCEREKFLSSSFVIHCLFEAHCIPPLPGSPHRSERIFIRQSESICPTAGARTRTAQWGLDCDRDGGNEVAKFEEAFPWNPYPELSAGEGWGDPCLQTASRTAARTVELG